MIVKRYWIGAVLSLLAMFLLNQIFQSVCLSAIFFGIPCPACGMTRAAKLMLTGHMKESLQMHPLLIPFILEVLFCLFVKIKLRNYRRILVISVIICLVIFVGFYIYRMLSFYPKVEPILYRQDNYLHRITKLLDQWKRQQ